MSAKDIDLCFKALAQVAEDLEAFTKNPLNFTRHRGDGWQVVLTKPEYIPRAALAFRTKLKSLSRDYDTYIGISEGHHEGAIDTDLNTINSSVFIASGEALELGKNNGTTRFSTAELHPSVETPLLLLELALRNWTANQCQALYPVIAKTGVSINNLVSIFGKSRQAIEKSWRAAGLKQVQEALLVWEHNNRTSI